MAATKSRNIIIVVVAAILALALLGTGIFFLVRGNQNDEPEIAAESVELTDAERFKESYESLNGTTREGSDQVYRDIEISADNPIVYVDIEQTLDLLKSEHAIIYIGANWCPHCRNAVPVLFEVAEQYELDKIYYLELDETKSLFEIRDGEVVKTREGTEEYYTLLSVLAERLSDYTLQDDEGNNQSTGEKRIYVPYVLAIKDGTIVGDYTGDVPADELEEGQTPYDPLTNAQHDKLFDVYNNLFRAVYDDSARDECEVVCD